jgi:hypothetical protein
MTPQRLSSLAAVALSLSLTLGPRVALAAESTWAQTLDTPAVSAHVAAHGGDVLIVSTGPASNARKEVVRALQAELEEAGSVGTVTRMDASKKDTALDDLSLLGTLDTAAARVAVVRVAKGRATVSVYDTEGTAIGGFSVSRGETIEPPAETSHTGDSVLAVLDDAPELDDDAMAEYDRKRVVFDASLHVTATSNTSAVVTRGFDPRTGAGAPLRGDEYYQYVGREDLAKEYRRRKAARTGLIVTGTLASATGLIVMLALPLSGIAGGEECYKREDPMAIDACEASNDARQKKKVRQGLGIGGGLLGGGLVMAIIGGRINPHTSTAAEIQEMGDDYNRQLRNKLGVSNLAVNGSAHRRGGGVVLSGRF